MSKTIETTRGTITIVPRTAFHELTVTGLYNIVYAYAKERLGVAGDSTAYASMVVSVSRIIQQTTAAPIGLPPSLNRDDVFAFIEALLALPADVVDTWQRAIDALNTAPDSDPKAE
jgi:hypothetical protein